MNYSYKMIQPNRYSKQAKRASEEVQREVSEANALEPEVQVQVTTKFSQLLPTKV